MSRKPVNQFAGDNLLHWIWDELPSYAECYMEATFTGHDAESAGRLVGAAPNDWRGLIALCAYWIGLPNPAYREIIDSVWNHDHQHLMGAARGGAPQVRRMMAAADFSIPLSGQVAVYRGTAGIDLGLASLGLSWTTSREVACWFARRFAVLGNRSLVIRATVDAADILYWSNERQEAEVVLRRAPGATIDGSITEWNAVAEAVNEKRRVEQLELLRAHQTSITT